MCGIAGFILPQGKTNAKVLENFKKSLEHRGPDDFGWLVYQNNEISKGRNNIPDEEVQVGFLHRRLSILDLSEAGWQPMSSQTEHLHIIFNGEIYNYIELRAELIHLGATFHTESDTEVLLEGFRIWGKEMLSKIVGMFAFALLDTQKNTILLVRDPFGIKPLYYAKWKNGYIFSSEIPAILELNDIKRTANPKRIYDYLRFGVTDHENQTFFQNIFQIPNGSYLEIPLNESQNVDTQNFWTLKLTEPVDITFDEAAKRLQEMFIDNVRLHLRSDVPVGTALSGGVDSSAIVSTMRLVDPKVDIHAFSYVAESSELSEEKWINISGSSVNANIHKVFVNSNELINDIEDLVALQAQPFGSTSIYAQYRVFQKAKESGIKVMLDGQGADEMLGGYPVYTAARFASLVKQNKYQQALQFLMTVSKFPDRRNTFFRAGMYLLPPELQKIARKFIGEDLLPSWLSIEWFNQKNVHMQSSRKQYPKNVLQGDLYDTLTKLHLPSLLRYEDLNSMHHSIESRVPFLTPNMADFLLNLPEEYLIDAQGTTKSVFRKAMRGIVPDEILDRKDKIGFSTPEKQWFINHKDWIKNVLNEFEIDRIPFFKYNEMMKHLDEMYSGKRKMSFYFWRWMNIILWAKKYSVDFS